MPHPNNVINQSELEANACYVMIGFGFTSGWLKKWRAFFNQSQSAVMQSRANMNYFPHHGKSVDEILTPLLSAVLYCFILYIKPS